jgi:hypothetical protein
VVNNFHFLNLIILFKFLTVLFQDDQSYLDNYLEVFLVVFWFDSYFRFVD